MRRNNNGAITEYMCNDLSGRAVAELDTAKNWKRQEVFLGATHLATYLASAGETYFVHPDWMGTERHRVRQDGTTAEYCDWYAYGEPIAADCGTYYTYSGYQQVSSYNFAGYERDSETGLDHMWFRYYNPRIGRFMRADLLGGDSADPQSMNRFAYVANSPTNLFDPLGLEKCPNGEEATSCVTGIFVKVRPEFGQGVSNITLCDVHVGLIPNYVICSATVVRQFLKELNDNVNRLKDAVCRALVLPAVPQSPPNANPNSNIEVARDRFNPFWYYNQVKGRGPWDYKRQGMQYENFGNFNYGATCRAFGFTDAVCLNEAGIAAMKAGTSPPGSGFPMNRFEEFTLPIDQSTHGDHPPDQVQIKAGIRYFEILDLRQSLGCGESGGI